MRKVSGTHKVEPARPEPPVTGCCGGEYAQERLVRLGAHPGVGVCVDCAYYLKRRAEARDDEHRRSRWPWHAVGPNLCDAG
jgi:hypothetical protein